MPPRTTRQAQLQRNEQQQSTSTETANGAPLQQQATSVETSTAVTQQQSQELLQSLLLGSLSTISYVRDLFPRDTFEIRTCDVNSEEPWSHKAWASGKVKTGGDALMPIYVLDTSKDYGAQTFVDWIEKSALDAIKFGFLRELQLRIFENPDHQEVILELWAFTISYHTPPGSNQPVVTNIHLNGPNGKRASLRNMKIGLVEFVKGIAEVAKQLPDLPDRRHFKFKFVYTENCPEDYHAPGFQTGSTTPYPLDNASLDGTKRSSSYYGSHHRVDLAVSRPTFSANPELAKHPLHSANSDFGGTTTRGLAQQDHETLNRDSDNGLHQTTLVQSGASSPPTLTDSITVLRPEVPQGQKLQEVESSQPVPSPTKNRPRSRSGQKHQQAFNIAPERRTTTGSPVRSEDHSQDKRERANLVEMRQQSRSEEVHDTQSVGPSQFSYRSGEPQDSTRTRPTEGKMKLTEAKISQLNEKRGPVNPIAATVKSKRNEGKEVVVCQCGTTDEEDEYMIFCDWCHTWQHCHCYGFLGVSDPRIPLKRACYLCLFDGEEDNDAKDVLNKLEGHALLRRGIHVIKEEGYRNQDLFQNALGVRDKKTASEIFHRLKKYGFVVPTPGSKKREFSKTGKPTYQIVNTVPGQSTMNKAFFNPLFLIGKYYTLEDQAVPFAPDTPQTVSQDTARNAASLSAVLDAEKPTSQYSQPARLIAALSHPAKRGKRASAEQDEPKEQNYNLRKRRTSMVDSYATPKRKSRTETTGSRATINRSVKRLKHDSPGTFFSRLMSPESVQSILPQSDEEL